MNPRTDEVEEAAESQSETFVETALKLSGKTDEEARKTGAIDRADDQVEDLFAPQYQTVNSPVHRAVWERQFPVDLFTVCEPKVADSCRKVMDDSHAVLKRHRDQRTMYDDAGKIRQQVLDDLAQVGYWGLLVDAEYGGQGSPFVAFARFITRMATVEANVAGLASVHGCIGAVDPLLAFGNEQQKRQYLPILAAGKRISAFALTEPCAGSDLTALRTTAVLDGDHYVVNGEKLFITNALPGRTIGLVVLIDERPAVLIADLPDQENEQFQLVRYGLYALRYSYNNGLRFTNFRVPKENLLTPARGDGLTIAYHGLNRGRVALCANAAGVMRLFLANMLPWAHYRKTYGQPIEVRELVRRRIGKLAGLIVAADALSDWTASLLDQGYRGEMECIIAKIFGSEMLKYSAIELFMKTHGGRSFLHGHLFGDNIHDFLAPCIYEGEGEMLGMAFLKSLIKEHGRKYFEPVGKALNVAGIRKPNLINPAHVWALRKVMPPYLKWRLTQSISGWTAPQLPSLEPRLAEHARRTAAAIQRSRLAIDSLMTRHQLSLPDRQCAMAELSQRIQNRVIMFVTALSAGRSSDPLVQTAGWVFCEEMRQQLSGRRPDSRFYRTVTELGESIASGGFSAIAGVEADEILMQYDND